MIHVNSDRLYERWVQISDFTCCRPFHSDAVGMTLSKLANADGGKTAGVVEQEPVAYQGITVKELSARWKETVRELAKREVTVTNEAHALEGALSIRYDDQTSPEAVGATYKFFPEP